MPDNVMRIYIEDRTNRQTNVDATNRTADMWVTLSIYYYVRQ